MLMCDIEARGWCQVAFSDAPPPYLLRKDLSLNLELSDSADSRNPPVFVSPAPGPQEHTSILIFYTGAGDLNTGPLACVCKPFIN